MSFKQQVQNLSVENSDILMLTNERKDYFVNDTTVTTTNSFLICVNRPELNTIPAQIPSGPILNSTLFAVPVGYRLRFLGFYLKVFQPASVFSGTKSEAPIIRVGTSTDTMLNILNATDSSIFDDYRMLSSSGFGGDTDLDLLFNMAKSTGVRSEYREGFFNGPIYEENIAQKTSQLITNSSSTLNERKVSIQFNNNSFGGSAIDFLGDIILYAKLEKVA